MPRATTATRWPSWSRSRRKGWEAYHAGYFNHIVNKNPTTSCRCPSCAIWSGKGKIGGVHECIYALPGVSTPVAISRDSGGASPRISRRRGVDGVLLVAT